MDHSSHTPLTMIGTICGFVISAFANIDSHDLLKTALLAAVGAGVGFFTTLFLKWLLKKYKDVFGK